MTEPPVDPALFRLRLFQREWQQPLLDSAASDALASLLLAEAEMWQVLGERLGYFAPDPSGMDVHDIRVTDVGANIVARIRAYQLPQDMTLPVFARVLADAREDLTPERRQLLCNLLFADEHEWREALGEVERVASDASMNTLYGESLSRVSWAVDGVSDDDDAATGMALPSEWRTGDLAALRSWVPVIADRWAELAGVRETIDEATLVPVVGETLFAQAKIEERVRELARQISEDYKGRNPVLVGVLKGAVFFASDLLRSIDVPADLDWVRAASYGRGIVSSGEVRMLDHVDIALRDRDVLIVDDITDTGSTLETVTAEIMTHNPASVAACVLLRKPDRQMTDSEPRYIGFNVPNRFVVGYGLDYNERFRTQRDISVLDLLV